MESKEYTVEEAIQAVGVFPDNPNYEWMVEFAKAARLKHQLKAFDEPDFIPKAVQKMLSNMVKIPRFHLYITEHKFNTL